MPALPLSLSGTDVPVPHHCSSDFPEAEGPQRHWAGVGGGLTLGQMVLRRRLPHVSLAFTPTSPLLANFLPLEVGPLLILSVGRASFSPVASCSLG